MLSTPVWSGEPFPTPSTEVFPGVMNQEESCRQNLLTQARFKAQPFPCSAGHTGTGQFRTHASCGVPQRNSPTKRPVLGGETATQTALQTNLVLIFTSCMKQPSQSTPVRNCKSYCMEQPSVGRKSYTYKATDLDR